ncbi:substrate-binding periplasmic protein [Vibrio sp. NH-UV-68]|uniref:substrate-binding periplasmic protein n=1 Tax=unclassified Vibrio TaxID=2614977 RepID=UPI0036F1BBD1
MTQLLIVISTLIFSTAIIAQDKVVRFAIGEWPPYTSSSNDPEQQVAQRVVVKAFESQGYQVQLDYFPWSRSFKLASEGKYDGTFPWIRNSERSKLFLYSEAVFTQTVVFFYHLEVNFSWQQLTDLNNYTIGATQDYQPLFYLNQAGITQMVSIDEETNFAKLVKRRIDAYPTGAIRGKYLIKNTLSQDEAALIKVDDKPIFEDEMTILFSKQNSARSEMLIDVFSQGMKTLYASGEYQKIMLDNSRVEPVSSNE